MTSLRYWLCNLICPDRIWNQDISRENDRLTILVEEAKASGRSPTQAEAALQTASDLITIPNAGGRYSSKILPEPERLYEVREALAEAIENID